ncbi:MAG TPA: hypothetical protein GXX75_15210 [Clostridiales bacterium]|nr:hypothetical protein [Clostridiales bacterium]
MNTENKSKILSDALRIRKQLIGTYRRTRNIKEKRLKEIKLINEGGTGFLLTLSWLFVQQGAWT